MEKNLQELSKTNKLVFVTGISGAGKSVAIKALEDLGFHCIDNLPLGLWDKVVDLIIEKIHKDQHCAIGTDVRDPDFAERFVLEVARIKSKIPVEIVFLNADDDTIISRFSTTRRRHPLAQSGMDLIAAIRAERIALSAVEQIATIIIDTSNISGHDLSRKIETKFSQEIGSREMTISFTSFGFQAGILKSSDNMFDVRFLPNPHYQKNLRHFSGLDTPVQEFFEKNIDVRQSIEQLRSFMEFVIPRYYKEGKHYLRIGVGCTGGKHRSVYVADKLAKLIAQSFPQFEITVSHRDLV